MLLWRCFGLRVQYLIQSKKAVLGALSAKEEPCAVHASCIVVREAAAQGPLEPFQLLPVLGAVNGKQHMEPGHRRGCAFRQQVVTAEQDIVLHVGQVVRDLGGLYHITGGVVHVRNQAISPQKALVLAAIVLERCPHMVVLRGLLELRQCVDLDGAGVHRVPAIPAHVCGEKVKGLHSCLLLSCVCSRAKAAQGGASAAASS